MRKKVCNSRLIQLESEHRQNNIISNDNSFVAISLFNPFCNIKKIFTNNIIAVAHFTFSQHFYIGRISNKRMSNFLGLYLLYLIKWSKIIGLNTLNIIVYHIHEVSKVLRKKRILFILWSQVKLSLNMVTYTCLFMVLNQIAKVLTVFFGVKFLP